MKSSQLDPEKWIFLPQKRHRNPLDLKREDDMTRMHQCFCFSRTLPFPGNGNSRTLFPGIPGNPGNFPDFSKKSENTFLIKHSIFSTLTKKSQFLYAYIAFILYHFPLLAALAKSCLLGNDSEGFKNLTLFQSHEICKCCNAVDCKVLCIKCS